MPLTSIEFWSAEHCPYEQSAYTQYLVLFYYAHYGIAAALFLFGLVHTQELYLLLLSGGIAFNWFVNYFLLWLFMMPVPTPLCGEYAMWCVNAASPYNACGSAPFVGPNPSGVSCGALPLPPCDPCVACGMPAVEPQLTGFTVTTIGIFAMQWRAPHIHLYESALLMALYAVVAYVHTYIGYNSPAQIFVGIGVGTLVALFFQLIVFWVAYPNFDRALRWPLLRYMGYVDTFCRSYKPVPGDPEPLGIDIESEDDDDDESQLLYSVVVPDRR